MKLDRNFVRSLTPPLSDILPHGSMKEIASEVGKGELTARNAIHGASSNPEVIRAAIKRVIREGERIEQFLTQLPEEVMREVSG